MDARCYVVECAFGGGIREYFVEATSPWNALNKVLLRGMDVLRVKLGGTTVIGKRAKTKEE